MKEISLHILDICRNSFKASANIVEVTMIENEEFIEFTITDDGIGIDEDDIVNVTNPFFTTKENKQTGLGLSLLKYHTEISEGKFSISSKKGNGTTVYASFNTKCINTLPLGDCKNTLVSLITNEYNCRIIYKHIQNENEFIFDSNSFKLNNEGCNIINTSVLEYINSYNI